MKTVPLEMLSTPAVLGNNEILISMLLSLGLGIIVALVYRFSVPGRLLSPTLQSSLILLALVSTMVMMVIGDNLARAFSLVGALSIVRFRTRLRSSWDISFVFFALSVGIGAGVGSYRVALISTAVICLAVIALQVLPLSGVRGRVQLLRCDLSAYQGSESVLIDSLTPFVKQRWLVEARSLRFGETLSLRYRVILESDADREAMLRTLSELDGVERVILYADETDSDS